LPCFPAYEQLRARVDALELVQNDLRE